MHDDDIRNEPVMREPTDWPLQTAVFSTADATVSSLPMCIYSISLKHDKLSNTSSLVAFEIRCQLLLLPSYDTDRQIDKPRVVSVLIRSNRPLASQPPPPVFGEKEPFFLERSRCLVQQYFGPSLWVLQARERSSPIRDEL